MLAVAHIIPLIHRFGYEIIFPIVILEGPIITVISGFLVSIGLINGLFTYFLIIIGDIIGDSLYYAAGRFWLNDLFIKKLAKFFGYREDVENILENHFKKHTGKTLLLGKLSYGLGAVVQITAGVAQVNYGEFLIFQILGTMPKALMLMLIGYYAGSSYAKVGKYLHSLAILTPLIVVGLIAGYIILTHLASLYFKK